MTGAEGVPPARLLETLAHKVHRHLGVNFADGRLDELGRRLRALAQQQGRPDIEGWLQELAFSAWDDDRLQTLVPTFSVGETYFRRDAAAFDWLEHHHLRPLIERRRAAGQRQLRLWSAACCTGEEAYGLLFLIDDLLGAERAAWRIELVASDINEAFLARARHGLYGRNAFRGDDDRFRRRYFQAEGRGWRVRPAWRERIRFVRFNLAEAAPLPLQRADLILCRNVLMYFSPAQATAALRRLMGSLGEGGLLMLSSVEAGIAARAGFRGRHAAGNHALARQDADQPAAGAAQRSARSAVASAALPPRAPHSRRDSSFPRASFPAGSGAVQRARPLMAFAGPEAAASREEFPAAPVEGGAALAPSAGAAAQPDAAALEAQLATADLSSRQRRDLLLQLTRHCLDRRELAQARTWLEQAQKLEAAPQAFWLEALLEQECGNRRAALQSIQKALYMEPAFVLAHFLQALLLRREGRLQASARALAECRRLLRQRPPAEQVAHAGGISCGELLQLCEQLAERGSA